jgi:hypothetical protein
MYEKRGLLERLNPQQTNDLFSFKVIFLECKQFSNLPTAKKLSKPSNDTAQYSAVRFLSGAPLDVLNIPPLMSKNKECRCREFR